MSKRSGEFFPLSQLLSEVNKDSIRFMMLYRSNDVEIEFDFNKILEKNKDNPVFYVQYCYARINSIFRSLKINRRKRINLNKNNFVINKFEEKLLRKIIEWPKVIETASNKLELIESHIIYTNYLPFFTHIGARVMKIKIISLLKTEK